MKRQPGFIALSASKWLLLQKSTLSKKQKISANAACLLLAARARSMPENLHVALHANTLLSHQVRAFFSLWTSGGTDETRPRQNPLSQTGRRRFSGIRAVYVSIEDQLGRELEASHVKNDGMITAIQNRYPYRFVRYADMRYVGQGFELTTRLPENLSTTTVDDIRAAFEHQYRLMFGTSIEGAPLEVLNWRVQAFAHQGQAILPIVNQAPSGGVTSARRRRAFSPVCATGSRRLLSQSKVSPLGRHKRDPP